jgi:elongation factor Ts
MEISVKEIKEIRELTGAGVMEAKKALAEAKGDRKQAIEILRKKGTLIAAKKASRSTREGLVTAYVHAGGKIGVILELNCETDFVARNPEFGELAHELALQIAATNPLYISRDSVPPEVLEKQKDLFEDEAIADRKPKNAIKKIVEGKMEKFYQESCLLDQPSIRDDKKTVADIVQEKVAKLGENIVVKRFTRYALGE